MESVNLSCLMFVVHFIVTGTMVNYVKVIHVRKQMKCPNCGKWIMYIVNDCYPKCGGVVPETPERFEKEHKATEDVTND